MKTRNQGNKTYKVKEKNKPTNKITNKIHLYKFLQELLNDPDNYSEYITWVDRDKGIFKIENTAGLSQLWGRRKNSESMNYDKLSRSLRHYYKTNILKKVTEPKCYQFLIDEDLEMVKLPRISIKVKRDSSRRYKIVVDTVIKKEEFTENESDGE